MTHPPAHRRLRLAAVIAAVALAAAAPLSAAALAGSPGGDGEAPGDVRPAGDLSAPLALADARRPADDGDDGETVAKHLAVAGRGARLAPGATTDVWTHDGYAYLGTFNAPCGTGAGFGDAALVDDLTGPGVPVFNVQNPKNPVYVGSIPSVAGSRINDVKVMEMSQGDILVHSNEACGGGPGGFEIYDVTDPLHPVHLAHVQTDDVNAMLRSSGYVDFGVHNLFLFTRDGRDYAAAQVEGILGSFQVFDITNPESVELVSWYGAEYLFDPSVDWATTTDWGAILDAYAYITSGHGASQNKWLHDHYVTPDGEQAYLAMWDAGLLLVDLGALDGSAATLVSQAIAPESEDGEVNSHSVWPTADGSIVVEGEEDFAPYAVVFSITTGDHAGEYPAAEGAITVPIASLPGQTMAGPTVYTGYGCEGSALNPGAPYEDPMPAAPSSDAIALIQRGGCFFSEKVDNAEAAGYAGVVVFNDEARGDALVSMGGDPTNLPGVFVGHSTGLKIAGVSDASELTVGAAGESVDATAEPDGWSGVRVWDYSDPANPVLAATFNTACSADPEHESCDPRGVYSSHNMIVEGTRAYISWYAEGVIVLDVSDPYNPVEVARYHGAGEEFEAQNGGPQDVWGVHKEPGKPWVYASDRNGGLYVLKELGSGASHAAP